MKITLKDPKTGKRVHGHLSYSTRRTRHSYWNVLSSAPDEVVGLRAAIVRGGIDGGFYQGACCCLLGTIANLKNCDVWLMISGLNRTGISRPAESFFANIEPGDTPENSAFSRQALKWLDQWARKQKRKTDGKTL
jgi:hypothetical protein